MAEDTQDQGMPSALRPRPGWEKAASNPQANHATVDVASISGTGYMGPSYQPPKQSPHTDAGEFDQSHFKEAQQGHRLARASSPNSARGGVVGISIPGLSTGAASDGAAPELEGAPRADGRPAWDSRFFLEQTAWEAQPRTTLLRPPSTNAFPGSSVRRSQPVSTTGRGSMLGEGNRSPGARRASVPGGLDGDTMGSRLGGNAIGSTDGNGTRTTILPGLNVAVPPMWASPYGDAASVGPGRSATSPGSLPGAGPTHSGTAVTTAAVAQGTPRPPRADLVGSYIARAYSPDQSRLRAGSVSVCDDTGGGGDISPERVLRQGLAADAAGEGGVDGHGTHLPALERAGYGRMAANGQSTKEKETQAAAEAKATAQKAAILALGAVYMPVGAKLRTGRAIEPRSARDVSHGSRLVAAPSPSLYARTCRSTDDDAGRRIEAGGRGIGASHVRDNSPGNGDLVWRPSGRQPIPETAPPVPKSTRRSSSGEAKETREEADRRRAAPRDQSIYSPARYPIVGMGWFLPPEKYPSNPAYAGVKARYLEARLPRSDDDSPKTPHMPDIRLKPWLNPGKHLLTDSSAPPPKMTGTAGARPPYAFSPAATGTSMATGATRSNKGAARSGRNVARGPGKGNGKKKKRSSSSRSSRTGGESGSDSSNEADGDREVLAVIGGVRLMSMIRRNDMADEARLEAEEDALTETEDSDAAEPGGRREQTRQGQGEAGGEGGNPELGQRNATEPYATSQPRGSPGSQGGEEAYSDSGRTLEGPRGIPRGQGGSIRGNSADGRRSSSRGSSEGADAGIRSRRAQAEGEEPAGKPGSARPRKEQSKGDGGELGGGKAEGGEYTSNDEDGDGDNDSVAAAVAIAGLGNDDGDREETYPEGDQEDGDISGDGGNWD